MGFRFRRSVALFPGVRVNISGSGASLSLGGRGATLNVGPRGVFGTVGIPGTGLSHRGRIGSAPTRSDGGGHPVQAVPALASPPPMPPVAQPIIAGDAIASAPVEAITSVTLADFQADCEHRIRSLPQLAQFAHDTRRDHGDALEEHRRALASWFTRTFRKKRLAELAENAELAGAAAAQAAVQLQDAPIDLKIELDANVEHGLLVLHHAFVALSSAHVIWDVTSRSEVDSFRERSIAGSAVSRTPVRFDAAGLPIFRTGAMVCHLLNANGGDLFFYPGFVAIASLTALAIVDFSEVDLAFSVSRFVEEEGVSADARVVGTTWLRVNKDGSPDKRFRDNRQLPVVEYGVVDISSPRGLRERYMISNAASARAFVDAFAALKSAVVGGSAHAG